MNLVDVLRTLISRWYLLIVGLAATGALCVVALQQVPPSYEARGTVLLLPPENLLSDGANPFLYLGGLEQPAEIVTKYLDADAPREALAATEPTAVYAVALDQSSTSGPVIAVTVQDVTPEGAVRVLNEVLDSIPAALRTLEESIAVPEGSSIGSMRLSVDETPSTVTKESLRAVMAAAAVGSLSTVLGIAVLDGFLRRRAAKRRVRRADVPAATDVPPGEDSRAGRGTSPSAAPGPGGSEPAEHVTSPLVRGRGRRSTPVS